MTLNTYKDGAEFSDDRKYRYALWRVWDASLPALMVVGLNPSTANESYDDATIIKVKKIAAHNGFGKVFMLNVFPIVSSDPSILKTTDQLNLGYNRAYLRYFKSVSDQVLLAWGNFKEAKEHSTRMLDLFPAALCLKQNKDGSPKHPLYCLDKSPLILFDRTILQ